MIPARKFPPGERLVGHLIYGSFRKYFDRIYFRMRASSWNEQRMQPAQPGIICANHFSWWDGYVAFLIKRYLHIDCYLMVEEAQLSRYFFFTWAGCFSVDRHNARSAIESLHYAARLLKEQPGRMVWLFPQGEIAPNDRRPLVFYSGAAYLARLTTSARPTLLYPLAARIEYMAEQRPDLYISMGEPLEVTAEAAQAAGFLKSCTWRLEERVIVELDQLRSDVLARNIDDFTLVLQGKASMNRIFDALFFRKQIARQ